MSRTIVNFDNRPRMFDARADRLDLRDRPYAPRVVNLPPEFPAPALVTAHLKNYIDPKAERILDQGQEGACTGFGLAAVINYLFWARDGHGVNVSPRMVYHLAKFYDEWPGEDYSGSSCRGALKGWHKHGVCSRELWPYTVRAKAEKKETFEPPKDGWDADAVTRPLGVYYRIDKRSVVDLQAALVEIGAIYVSADVHSGWELSGAKTAFADYQSLPEIRFGSATKVSGGHAFAIVGYTATGFVVQNSWGPRWGQSGFAIMTYADWVANGTDAWTVSLGVPIAPGKAAAPLRSPRAYAGASGGLIAALAGAGTALPDSPTGKDYWKPLDPATALERMVVMGNNGMPINRLVECGSAAEAVAQVTRVNPQTFFATQPAGAVRRLALYAHGGLNTEEESIVRTRILAPYFAENGIYPLFITWKSGAGEIIENILQDRAQEVGTDQPFSAGALDKLKEAALDTWDRAIELLAQNLGAKSIWSEMKQNAQLGTQPGNALSLLAAELAALRQVVEAQGEQFELHLIGHSAGSIVLGHLLDLLAKASVKQTLASCSLFAPACTVAFANDHYIPAVEPARILPKSGFHIDVLSDNRERGDTVGPYQKSLLYLVSRALEDMHKMPVLGLLKAFDPACNHDEHWNQPQIDQLTSVLERWQNFWWGTTPPADFYQDGRELSSTAINIVDRMQIDTGVRNIGAAHGTFDNDVAVVRTVLARVLGAGAAITPPAAQWNLDY